MGTGEPEFPELAEILKHFASPFQHRPACSGPVAWKDWPAAQADIDLAKAALQGTKAEDIFMTSPSPGQIARYLKNRYYKTDEEYIYALADVMQREYQAIVEAGFILQLDCPDLAMLRHMVYLDLPLADYRKIISVNVAALNHAVRDLPPDRMRMHVCWGSTMAPHHTDVPIKDIVDIVLSATPHAVSFPAANARHEHEWKVWRDVKLPAGKTIIPGVIDFDDQRRRASGSGRRPHPEFRRRGRARECHRRRRLRFRHLRRPRAGRHEDRLAQASVTGRGRAAGEQAVVGQGGVARPEARVASSSSLTSLPPHFVW